MRFVTGAVVIEKFITRLFSAIIILVLFITTFLPQSLSLAANSMSVEPITWNVIGLDSNRPADGPKDFPVGIRACNPASNSVTFSDVEADFVWLTGGTTSDDTYLKLRPGSLDPIQPVPQIDLGPGTCYDFYFEVEVSTVAGSFDQTRRYRIDVTYDDPDTGSRETITSPTPRELYVEYLISQNRNSVIDVELDGDSVPAGGTMDLLVGETYTISLDATTATQGYEQIESFIHFPNTIFQVISVNTAYSADSSAHVDNPNDKLYGNSCLWENDPDNPNYRSCLDVGKNGGSLRVDYVVKIIGGAGTSDTLNSLIYDFSGSSYHYNADYSISYRNFNVIGPSSIDINKRFIPDSITSGSSSTLSFTIPNPTSTTIAGVNFTDPLPAGMAVNTPPNVSVIGCGTPTFAPAAGATILNFSAGEIAPNSSCLIKVDITVASDGTYLNTTNNLYIDGTTDTGNFATDTLVSGSAPACTPGQTMAVWTVPATTTNPPDQSSPVAGSPSTVGTKISTASVSAAIPGSSAINSSLGVGDSYSWNTWGYKTPVQTVDFVVDTSSYIDVQMEFYEQTDSPGPTALTIYYDSGSGITAHPSTPTIPTNIDSFTIHNVDFTGLTNSGGNTTFRISGTGANNDQSGANLFLDNITFTGCLESDPPPTIIKSFGSDPVTVYATSILTFTLSNTDGAAVDLTGVEFTDLLPSGLEVANPPNASTTCAGLPTWAPLAGDTNLIFGTPAGATMAANSSCTLAVDITAAAAGFFENISDYISSDQSGENKTSSGYATDSLTVVAPPSITKNFSDATILTGNTSTLSFTITNPNQSTDLTGIGFTDTLPAGLDIATNSISVCSGTLATVDNNPALDEISLAGGTILAGSSCSFDIVVTGSTPGSKDNLTGAVTSTEGGAGNTASASVFVKEPAITLNILKQIGISSGADDAWSKSLRIDGLPTDIYYKFIVENVGDVDLTSIRIFDPPGDYPTNPLSACTFYEPTDPPVVFVEPLSPGEYIYCVTGPVTVSNPGSNTNTAIGYGTYGGTDYPSGTSSAYYGTPEITLSKSAAEDYFAVDGDSLSYSYEVENTGFVDLEGPLSVTDDKTTVSCPATNTVGDLDNYLDVGEILTCTASYTVTSGDVTAGSVTNTASGTINGTSSGNDSVTVPHAAYTITKSVIDVDGGGSGGSVDAAGDVISYQVVVENTGNYPLTGVNLADTLVAVVGVETENVTDDDILEVGETWTWTYTYTALQDDLNNNGGGDGDIDNTATVSSTEIADQSSSAAVPIVQAPALTLVKSITSGDPYAAVTDVIAYSFLVTNTGNVSLAGPVTIDDDQATDESCPAVNTVGNFDVNLDPGESLTCTASYTVDQADLNAGSVVNIADASAGGTTSPTDTQTATATQAPALTLVKNSTVASITAAGQVVPYDYVVSNNGNITLTNVTLADNNTDNIPVCVPAQPAALDPGDTMLCTAAHTVTAGEFTTGGNLSNTATADSDQTAPVQRTLDIPIISIFDPPFGIKDFDDSGLPSLRWTMVWINDSNTSALDVVVNDPIPVGTTFVTGSLQCIPRGSSNTAPGPGTCDFESGNNRIHWEGTIGPDPGATGESDAANEVVITFLVNIPSGLMSSSNTAVLDADLNGNGIIDPGGGETTAATASASWVRSALPSLPGTGFEPGVVTEIPHQTQERIFNSYGDLWLEIPAMNLKTNIVGVPLVESSWDVSWLSNSAGWLEGSAFPSHIGNSILTAHVYLPSGLPGPFVDLHRLKWDDQIIVHAFGRQYIYQVRANKVIQPDDSVASRHEEYPWITLITCKGFNDSTDTYDYRVLIRAVLMDVKPDYLH